ncbi:MAG TPA: hypothetical protein VEK56_10645 [Vicinamibacterales bacterium]|nr:hypothetical protein [Vicinamibacterales bacterium]
MIRRIVATTLAAFFAVGISPYLLAAQAGSISGKATGEAKKPYTDYNVQLVDTATHQLVTTVPLDTQGRYAFPGVEGDKRYFVHLFSLKENKIVCTEDVTLVRPRLDRPDININCDKPSALWLLGAAAGVSAGVAIANQSPSQ